MFQSMRNGLTVYMWQQSRNIDMHIHELCTVLVIHVPIFDASPHAQTILGAGQSVIRLTTCGRENSFYGHE